MKKSQIEKPTVRDTCNRWGGLTTRSALRSLLAPLFLASAVTGYTTGQAGADSKNDAALEVLRSIARTPSHARSMLVKSDALLVTGSVVKSGGTQRVLYHLPASEQGLRLHGESASLRWPVYIAEQQLAGDIALRLAYKNAVSVMPEASNIAVEINGVMIGKRTVQSPDRSRTLEFKVPSHILVPGYNAVRVLARQRHRVDCSIGATHELWTDIDPAKTGFVFGAGNSVLNTLQGLSALARNKGGQIRMRLIAPNLNDVTQVERSMALAQRAAVHANFENAHVEVAGSVGEGPGLDVFTGDLATLQNVAPAYAKAVRDRAGLQILSRDGDERVALILLQDATLASYTAYETTLDGLFQKRALRGSPAGLRAARLDQSRAIEKGEPIRFDRFGLSSEEFDGRLYRRSIGVDLPSDYFAADYNQAEINLATAYAAGLDRSAKFIVRVNGVTVTGFAMARPKGYVYKNKMLRVPLSAFRPGANTVEFEARLPNDTDRACDAAAQINAPKRFVISGKSTIRFPRLAHLARLPSLGGTVGSGFPYVINGKPQPTTVSVATPGYDGLSAVASFATQVAVKARTPLKFKLEYGQLRADAQNAIIVGSYSDLPTNMVSRLQGFDKGAFSTAWMQNIPGTSDRQFASYNLGRQPRDVGVDYTTTAGIAEAKVAPKEEFKAQNAASATPFADRPFTDQTNLAQDGSIGREDLFDNWTDGGDKPEPGREKGIGITDQVSQLVGSAFGLGKTNRTQSGVIVNTQSDLLLSQTMAPGSDRAVWTVLTARDEAALRSGVALLARPAIANRISGETASINAVDRTVTSTIVGQNYVQLRGFSLWNAHLIVAGWFSNNHFIFSLLLLFGILGGGVVSSLLLRRVGANGSSQSAKAAEAPNA
ncbi:MAG: cellulose biosynthesis cyclic di-GMP-binding regulatory protein BcsB [Pseudomonadota bacterium]